MWNHQPVTFGYSLNFLEEHIPHMVSGMEILGQFRPTNRGHRCPQKKIKKYRTVDTPIFPKKIWGKGIIRGISWNIYEYLWISHVPIIIYFENFPDSACFSHQNLAIPMPFPGHSQAPWGPPAPGNILEVAYGMANSMGPLGVTLVQSVSAHKQVMGRSAGISWKFGCDWDVNMGCFMI